MFVFAKYAILGEGCCCHFFSLELCCHDLVQKLSLSGMPYNPFFWQMWKLRSRSSELVNCRHWMTPDFVFFLMLLNVHTYTATFSFSSSSGEVGTSTTWVTDIWSCVILGQGPVTSSMPGHQGADLGLKCSGFWKVSCWTGVEGHKTEPGL